MKAIVLAAGKGKRLDSNKNKCMTMVEGTPLIEFSFMNAMWAGCKELIVVIGHQADDIVNHFGSKTANMPIQYIHQTEQKGILHALRLCTEHIGEESVMVMFGDEVIINSNHGTMELTANCNGYDVLVGVVKVKDKYRICETYTIGCCSKTIYRLVEKPQAPFNNWMGTGNCFFTNKTFRLLDKISIERLCDMEFVEFIQILVDAGYSVKRFDIGEDYENVNTKENLERLKSRIISRGLEKTGIEWVK